jgi:FkbM family methyltransferase
MGIEQRGEWWWPEDDTEAEAVILRECEHAVPWLLGHVTGRECIVQAGGNVGVYAVALRKHFKIVQTAEPDPTNLQCLVRNLLQNSNDGVVKVYPGGLWSENLLGSIHVHQPGNCGAHQVRPEPRGENTTSLATIDSLGLTACDAIWLDIEGSELPALKGAERTIALWHPVIVCEEKGIGQAFGYHDAEIEDWLSQRGYSFVERHYSDRLYRFDM